MKDLAGSSKARHFRACLGTSKEILKALVHGDDLVSSGERTGLERLCRGLKKKFETKMTMMAKEARVLNRIVRWHPRKGITFEADPRHAEFISRDTGAENLKTISTPAAEEAGRETEEDKRQDLNVRRLSGKVGCKPDDDDNGDA